MAGRTVPVLVLSSLLVCLAFTGESRAQKGKHKGGTVPDAGKKELNKAEKQAENERKQQMNLREAELLREAYLLLAAANHNYDGHRVKAMEHIHAAYKRLDHKVLKNGTAAQKAVTEIEDTAAARARVLAKHTPKVHEPQAVSDFLLRKGGELLARVTPILKARHQSFVLEQVVEAEREIGVALKIR